ncbi:MRG-domain-containing protein [Rickenella mellea]|uniref:Chromatin modification-related protein EAF3 n=1 Tax=Rickenella mellea TaxID=50990 RepID=A0A4Y7PZG9_9AGAM|nr:MRG-domain-containing protein [Rickenella mellea]
MPDYKFSVGERVLCYHGPLIYEAKVLKLETWTEENTRTGILGPHYFVHYKGWKQTWDEWAPENRILKYNEENLALQKEIQATEAAHQSTKAAQAQKTAYTSAKSSTKGTGSGRKEGARGTKRGRDEDDGTKKPEMKLNIPDILKARLVDDWEAVTKNSQLLSVPRTPNVQELLEEFKAHVLALPKPPMTPQTLLPTITAGLQLYFDRSLGANLLYRFERPQYAEMRKRYVTGQTVIIGKERDMSAVYGAEHLLRMIVSLPSMVASSSMDPESVNILREYVHELLNFMVKERDRIFQTEYETASSQYQNLSRS